jgi:hypothetical protein
MRLADLAALLAVSASTLSACDLQGPETCPAISGSGGSEDVEDHREYAGAAASFSGRAAVREAIEPSLASGPLRIRVDEVESVDVWRSNECRVEDTLDIQGANVVAQVTSADGSLTLLLPAFVSDADTDAAALHFLTWSSTDPDVLAQLPDTALADDAEIGMVDLEVADGEATLYRTDMVSCTMVEDCSDTTRHVLLRWSDESE